jgi:hypothetical protein
MGLAEDLLEWTDVDVASYELGRAVGLFQDRTFLEVKGVFWSNNPLGRVLYDILGALATAGVLEYREQPDDQFRWKTAAPLDSLKA